MPFDSYDALARGRRKGFRRLMLTAALIFVAALPLLYLAARRLERAIVFRPLAYYDGPEWRLPERGEDVWFETADGVRLHGWFVRAAREPKRLRVVEGAGHNDLIATAGEEYLDELASFIRESVARKN